MLLLVWLVWFGVVWLWLAVAGDSPAAFAFWFSILAGESPAATPTNYLTVMVSTCAPATT